MTTSAVPQKSILKVLEKKYSVIPQEMVKHTGKQANKQTNKQTYLTDYLN